MKLSLEKVRKDQSFFSNLAWRCETFRKVPRSRAVIWFKCPCTHMRYRLRHFLPKTHVSKPCSPVHVSPHLSTFEIQNYLWRQWSEVFFSKSLKPSRDSCMCTGEQTHATSQAPALMKCANFLRLKHIFMQPSCFLRALNNSSTSFLPKRCQFFTKRGTTCVMKCDGILDVLVISDVLSRFIMISW